MIPGIGRVSEWCDLWGMKLSASKTKTMIVSRSRTMHPQPPPLTIVGTVLKESDDLVVLGVTFNFKMTFEKHLRSVSRAASQNLVSWESPGECSMIDCFFGRCFRGFVPPVLEYCSSVWCSAADTHLKLLDCAVSGAQFLTGGVFECDIAHCRSVALLYMLYKIRFNPVHPLNGALPGSYVPLRLTRCAVFRSHIGTLMRRLAAEPRSTAGLLFFSQCPSRTILLTPYSMVSDFRVTRAVPMLFLALSALSLL